MTNKQKKTKLITDSAKKTEPYLCAVISVITGRLKAIFCTKKLTVFG